MDESNPYKSPQPQIETPQKQRPRYHLRDLVALVLMLVWVVSLLTGFLLAIMHFASRR